MAAAPELSLLRFGPFELDRRGGELRQHGQRVQLAQQPLRVLTLLAERPGEVLSREELRAHVWGDDTFVDFERGLNFCILQIRRALDDDARSPRYVETVPRQGYRLIVPVVAEAASASAAPAAPEVVASRRPMVTWLLAGGLAALVIGALVAGGWFLQRPPEPGGDKVLLAVLPFDNLSGDPEQEYFSDGLTEEMIAQLGGLDPQRLGVIARTSVMRFKDSRAGIDTIGRELGVDYVLEGSVRRDDEQVRITAQLIQVRDQTHLWSASYDRNRWGALVIQRDVAAEIADALELELLPGSSPLPDRAGSHLPAAHDAYLKGRYLLHRGDRESLQRSLEPLRQAADLDPAFALPRAALAEALHQLAISGSALPREVYPEATAAAEAALELDGSLAEAHAIRATIALWFDWDAVRAERGFARALELNPSLAAAHHNYGWYLLARGRPEDGLRELRRARDLDPLSPEAYQNLGWAYLHARRYDEAIAQCQRVAELEPERTEAAVCIERAQLLAGKAEGAEAARQLHQHNLDRLLAAAEAGQPRSFTIASHYALLGDPDAAFTWLERAYQARSPSLALLAFNPEFDALRTDPRFGELVARIGMAGGSVP